MIHQRCRILYEVDASDGDSVVALVTSCRTQLNVHVGDQPPHPVEKFAAALGA